MLTQSPSVAEADEQNAQSGLVRMAEDVQSKLSGMDDYITGHLREVTKPDSTLMALPKHLTAQFARWDAADKTPEQHKMYDTLKRKLIEMHETQANLIKSKVESNAEKMNLEFSIKAIGKATTGMQSLLSQQS